MSAQIIKYRIKNKDNRKNYCNILRNIVFNTAVMANWFFSDNYYCASKEYCDIEIEKKINSNTIKCRIQIIINKELVDLVIEPISFHTYGLKAFFTLFRNNINNQIFEIVNSTNKKLVMNDSVDTILKIINKFHNSVQQIKERHEDRTTITINDEYDMQDYLYAILVLFFDDIRKEDPIRKYAGASSRIDFFIPKEKIGIETKYATNKLKDKQLGEQIAIDIQRYKGNEQIETLIFFVYDPDYNIKNPKALEKDFEKIKDIKVMVRVVPQ